MGKISYKIDRLINDTLQLGLKTGATISGKNDGITVNKLLKYSTDLTPTVATDLTPKSYVDNTITTEIDKFEESLLSVGESGTFVNKDRITMTIEGKTDASAKRKIFFSLKDAYLPDTMRQSYDKEREGFKILPAPDKDEDLQMVFKGKAGYVVENLVVNADGSISNVGFRKLSTADLDNAGNTFDNYKHWTLQVGEAKTDVLSSLSTNEKDRQNILSFNFTEGLFGELNTATPSGSITAKILYNTTLEIDADGNLGLKKLHNGFANGLYKTTIDAYGRITEATKIENVTNLVDVHTEGKNGLVNALTSNKENAVSDSTLFYTSKAKWASIPFDKVKNEAATGTHPILLSSAKVGDLVSTYKVDSVTVDTSGKITATSFAGSGAELTTLNADNISSGTLSYDRLPQAIKDIDATNISKLNKENGQILITDASGHVKTINNPKETLEEGSSKNYVLTKTLTNTQDGTLDPSWEDITTLVKNSIGSGGMTFRGTIGNEGTSASLKALPTTFAQGDFYKIISKMTLAGNKVEPGDTIYAVSTGNNVSEVDQEKYWSVLQANIEGAVVFNPQPSATSGVLPFKSSNDAQISDSAISYSKQLNANPILGTDISGNSATTTKLKDAVNLWGNPFDGSASVSGKLEGVGNIIPETNNASTIGNSDHIFANVFATSFTGNLKGTADHAKDVENSLTFTNGSTVVYNGSKDETVDLSATALGYLNNVTMAAASGEGNIIKTVNLTKDGNSVKLEHTKAYAIDSITSSSFSASVLKNEATINFWNNKPTGTTFYTSSTEAPTGEGVLRLNGILFAKNLKIVGDNASELSVAIKPKKETVSETPYDSDILVADNMSSDYGFAKSGVKVSTNANLSAVNDDKHIPTVKVVKKYVDDTHISAINGSVKCITIDLGLVTKSSSETILTNSIIDHIDLTVETPYVKNSALTIKCGTSVLVKDTENELKMAGDVFTYKIMSRVSTDSAITVELTDNKETSGKATICVYYTLPKK